MKYEYLFDYSEHRLCQCSLVHKHKSLFFWEDHHTLSKLHVLHKVAEKCKDFYIHD